MDVDRANSSKPHLSAAKLGEDDSRQHRHDRASPGHRSRMQAHSATSSSFRKPSNRPERRRVDGRDVRRAVSFAGQACLVPVRSKPPHRHLKSEVLNLFPELQFPGLTFGPKRLACGGDGRKALFDSFGVFFEQALVACQRPPALAAAEIAAWIAFAADLGVSATGAATRRIASTAIQRRSWGQLVLRRPYRPERCSRPRRLLAREVLVGDWGIFLKPILLERLEKTAE